MTKPALPPRQRVEYILGEKEYSIEELANSLEEAIPFTVLVTRGYSNTNLPYHGLEENKGCLNPKAAADKDMNVDYYWISTESIETKEENVGIFFYCLNLFQNLFCKAYRVQCVSRGRRVLAILDQTQGGSRKFYSISEGYYINMVRVGDDGQEIGSRQSVYQLLSDNKLPIRAKFVSDKFSKVDGRALFTSHIPPLTLVHMFEEVNILLNSIHSLAKYDEMNEDILYVPQFYDKIRMKMVKGIRTMERGRFLSKEEALNNASGALEFDMQYSHMDMAEIVPHKFNKHINYSNIEPIRSGKIPDLFPKQTPRLPDPVYAETTVSTDHHEYFTIGDERLKRDATPSTKPGKTGNYTNDIPRGQAMPQVKSKSLWPENSIISANLQRSKSESDDISHGQAIQQVKKSRARHSRKTSASKLHRSQSETKLYRQVPPVNDASDIKRLTIDDVAAYLDMLNLGLYREIFKDHLIDGVVLSDLDKDILIKEFGFKVVDAIKLMHFIKDGHVPR